MGPDKLQTLASSLRLVPAILLAAILLKHLASCCSFPSAMHMDAKDPPWYNYVRADGTRDVKYYIRHNVMEIHYTSSAQQPVRWKCSMQLQGKLMLKRQDHLVNSYYRCARFIFRSRSVVQILWSQEFKTFDLSLCDDSNLIVDPWPLIWFKTLDDDYKPCPFSGGFDMKIIDSLHGENGCNLMLRPMRMEAECVGGEGVTFNFVSTNCLPDINMYVNQRTICVTDWQDSKNHYVILRRNEEQDLWCLVMPIHRGRNVTAYLFSDLTCQADTELSILTPDIKFFTLLLHTRVFPTLCEDEYDQCNKVTCNAYVKQECQKSCGSCSSATQPRDCEYPRSLWGTWFIKDADGYKNIDINGSRFTVDGVGSFQCASYLSSSPSVKSPSYTTISLYQNGCRPRYTCIKLSKIGPSVLQFSLSHSYVWPVFEKDLGKSICSQDRFHADSSPMDDRYRSHEGSGKPIVSYIPKPESIDCNVTLVHTVNATLPEGYICPGTLFQHCEDPRKLRLEFNTCGSLIPASRDYKCLANFEGHYWERLLLVQNIHDDTDVMCFVFSQFYPIDSYILVAGQCDQKSFNFARTGLRQPLLKFTFRTEQENCKSAPTNLNRPGANLIESSSGLPNSQRGDSFFKNTHHDSNSPDSGSIASGSHAMKMEHTNGKGLFNNRAGGHDAANAKSSSLDHANLLTSHDDRSMASSVTRYFLRTLIFANVLVLFL